MLDSTAQENESTVHMLVHLSSPFRASFLSDQHRAAGGGSSAHSAVPPVTYFTHSFNSVYASTPTSQFLPPAPFLLDIHTSVLYACVSTSALQIRPSVLFFRFHRCELTHSACFPPSAFTPYDSLGPSTCTFLNYLFLD